MRLEWWGLGLATGLLVGIVLGSWYVNNHKYDGCEPMSFNSKTVQWYGCKVK